MLHNEPQPASSPQKSLKLPDFAGLSPRYLAKEFAESMAEQQRLLNELAANPEPATAENTLGAWEDARRRLSLVKQIFYPVKAADTTPDLDALETELAPKLAAHNDEIFLNRALYERLQELRMRQDSGEVNLDSQDAWALDDLIRCFIRSGAGLDPAAQRRLRELNIRLAELSSCADQNIRGARNAGAVMFSRTELDGLSEEEIESLRTEEGYRVELLNTSRHPLLAKLTSRDARKRLYQASVTRATSGEYDNRQVIIDIARARAERARLLGYPNHAALIASSGVAKHPDGITGLIVPLAQAALDKAKQEATELSARFAELYPGEEFAAWDWAYVEAILRKERFDIDEDALTSGLTPQKVLKAVFAAAKALYGIDFVRDEELRGHTAEAEVYQVLEADGSPLGLFIMDYWARPTKNGGAWMNSIVVQSERYGDLPIVTNNCNFSRTDQRIAWSGVITMFHEFGHALHGLFSQVRYPSRSGTAVPGDFVEFPSQVNEHWAWQPGRVLSGEVLAKLKEAQAFGQGFASTEMIMATLLDQSWHLADLDELPGDASQVEAFEQAALKRWGIDYDLIPPRYRSAYFRHIWAGGYAAGYYGYLWSEVMDADTVAWFEENRGETRSNGDLFRATVLARGGSIDPAETYRAFRGRDPKVEPLLERLGCAAEDRDPLRS